MGPILIAETHPTIAVLAAGASRRFGEADKLLANFRGKPLGLHVPDALRDVPAAQQVIIAADEDHVCAKGWAEAGFSIVRNPNAVEGMGTSVAIAARIARRASASFLLVALADMPLVPLHHYSALIAQAQKRGAGAVTCSFDGASRMPPAVFGAHHFDVLAELVGDQGARRLLDEGDAIECPREWLVDVDTPGTLTTLE